MKKRICFSIIVCCVSLSAVFAIAAEEQALREELAANPSEMEVSYQEYRAYLEKLIDGRRWDANLKYILFPLGAVALGVVVIFFIRQIRLNLIGEAQEEGTATELEHVETERAALARAETAEAASDFREALRFLYLSAILHLQERGVIPYDKSLTNREYLHQAQSDTELHTALGPAITVFDEVWYGHRPCNAETVAGYRDLLQKVYARH